MESQPKPKEQPKWKMRETMDKDQFNLWDRYILINNILIKFYDSEQKYLKTLLKAHNELDFKDLKDLTDLKYVGGVDISFYKNNKDYAISQYVILSFPDLKVIYQDFEQVKLTGPYIPGLLAFREAAHLVKLIEKQKTQQPQINPQVILTDGNGLQHPNACGLACHLGLLIDLPTFGVGKTVFAVDGLTRKGVEELCHKNNKKGGDAQYLKGNSGKIWGAGFKPKDNVKKPIIISIGHKIDLDTCLTIVRRLCLYRVPEPVRQADIISRQHVRELKTWENAITTNKLEFLSLKKKTKPQFNHESLYSLQQQQKEMEIDEEEKEGDLKEQKQNGKEEYIFEGIFSTTKSNEMKEEKGQQQIKIEEEKIEEEEEKIDDYTEAMSTKNVDDQSQPITQNKEVQQDKVEQNKVQNEPQNEKVENKHDFSGGGN